MNPWNRHIQTEIYKALCLNHLLSLNIQEEFVSNENSFLEFSATWLKKSKFTQFSVVKCIICKQLMGFPDSSVGIESTCNAGDSGLNPGSGRSTGERIGYSLQYSWDSLVVPLVKNPPAKQETPVRFLGLEDPLEKRKATHSSILAQRIPCTVQPTRSQRVKHD